MNALNLLCITSILCLSVLDVSVQGEFVCPHGLVVDSSGMVDVCDRDNGRIQVF